MKTLNQDIKTKDFKRVYLLFGEERFLIESYKKKMREAVCGDDTMNFNYFEGKDIDVNEIISLADTMPFFSDRRLILVDSSGFFKSSQDALAEYMGRIPDTTVLVFCETEVDKRNRLYKKVKEFGYPVEFARQTEQSLMNWAAGILGRSGKKITSRTLSYFLMRTGDDMENIRQELEKLISYTMGREVVTEEDVDAIGTVQVQNHIFEMVSAIVAGNTKKALGYYDDLLTLREPPLRILFLVARQFNQLLQVKDVLKGGGGQSQVASALKLKPFIAGKLITSAKAFRREDILSYVNFAVDLEEAVKTGQLSDRLAVELLITKQYR